MEKSRLKSSLFFKNIVPNPTCDLCECEIEDIIHVLRDCVEARKVWDHFNAKHDLLVGTKDEWCKSNMLIGTQYLISHGGRSSPSFVMNFGWLET